MFLLFLGVKKYLVQVLSLLGQFTDLFTDAVDVNFRFLALTALVLNTSFYLGYKLFQIIVFVPCSLQSDLNFLYLDIIFVNLVF